MLVEIHMIQNHSPSNLTRDDLGAPKTCLFGGVTRARMSSQCLKRSIRNPGNPEDVHNRGRGVFAEAMSEHIGVRTKLFPWLVKQELKESGIPEEEHERIVMAAQRVAMTKEKEQKKSKGKDADDRPKTPQLISFGRGDAKRFVAKLADLRTPDDDGGETSGRYSYFLNPRAGFEEMVRGALESADLEEKTVEKIAKASWVIAKCRMSQIEDDDAEEETEDAIPGGETSEETPSGPQHQPGELDAKRIAEVLGPLSLSTGKADKERFKKLTEAATKEEKAEIKEDEPKKPPKMNHFTAELKDALTCKAVDFALFGRMTTSDYFDDIEAAMQVAHAISTHAVVNEVDYWTAVDDLGKTGGGAGHVDEAMFNSACFYKYFSLDWDQLVENLAGPEPDEKEDAESHRKWEGEIRPQAQCLAACTVGHFIRAAAHTTPSGKQNSFASHTEPCGILVEIKKNGKTPTNYANAFAEPVERIGRPDDDARDEKSIEGRSVACLADHVQAIRTAYGIDSTLLWYSPKLWRFPLHYWERAEDGKKQEAKPVVAKENCYGVLAGNGQDGRGLLEAVTAELGFKWSEVMDAGTAKSAGAPS